MRLAVIAAIHAFGEPGKWVLEGLDVPLEVGCFCVMERLLVVTDTAGAHHVSGPWLGSSSKKSGAPTWMDGPDMSRVSNFRIPWASLLSVASFAVPPCCPLQPATQHG